MRKYILLKDLPWLEAGTIIDFEKEDELTSIQKESLELLSKLFIYLVLSDTIKDWLEEIEIKDKEDTIKYRLKKDLPNIWAGSIIGDDWERIYVMEHLPEYKEISECELNIIKQNLDNSEWLEKINFIIK